METKVLTKVQKRQWKEDGYFVLKDVLSPEEIQGFTAVLDQMCEEYHQGADVKPEAVLDERNLIDDYDIFIELIDHPVTFPVVLELLGPYIQLSMSSTLVRPPNPKDKGYLHTDGGQAMRQIRVSENSLPLQIKIMYFLTDVDVSDSGNFTVVPGSHNHPFPEEGIPEGPNIPEAVQLCVKAGDAAVFPHSLWHGAAVNRSDRTRKTLIYCYSHQCFRAFDYEKALPEVLAKCTPRQRRLLGDIGEYQPGAYFYSPSDQAQVITELNEKNREN